MNNLESFQRLKWWQEKFMANSKGSSKRLPKPGDASMPKALFMVLGNKCDMESGRQVRRIALPVRLSVEGGRERGLWCGAMVLNDRG